VQANSGFMLYRDNDSERFEEWFENNLLAKIHQRSCRVGSTSLEKGETIIMDRASFHRKGNLEKLCQNNGAHLLLLSPYSPDFNPIEKTQAFMKRELRDTAPIMLETAIYKYLS
jgi:hypothetical protein